MKASRLFACALAFAAMLCLPSVAGAAKYGYYTVTFKGSQTVNWSITGAKTDSCAVYTGNGRNDFKFKGTKRKVLVNSYIGAFYVGGGGTSTGTFYVDTTSNCAVSPGKSYSGETLGCGAMKFKPELEFYVRKGKTWVHSTLGSSNNDDRAYDCAHYLQLTGFDEGQLDVCGPKEDPNGNFYNEALRDYSGQGIFPAAFKLTPKTLLKIRRGRSKTFKVKKTFDCSPGTSTGLVIPAFGSLNYSLTFKRTG